MLVAAYVFGRNESKLSLGSLLQDASHRVKQLESENQIIQQHRDVLEVGVCMQYGHDIWDVSL